MSNSRDEIRWFLTGDLEEEGWAVMPHDNMDLSKMMVHVQQVEESQKKRGVRDTTKLNLSDQAGLSNVESMNNFVALSSTYSKRPIKV